MLSDALHILESLNKGIINFTELRHNKGKYKTVSRIQTSSENTLKGEMSFKLIENGT